MIFKLQAKKSSAQKFANFLERPNLLDRRRKNPPLFTFKTG